MQRRALCLVLFLISLLVPLTSCQTTANAAQYEGDGAFVQHLRLRFAPADTKPFEALMENCVAVASEAELGDAFTWLCYRESPGRYWIISFGEARDAFPVPGQLDEFVDMIKERATPDGAGELTDQLAALEYETEWLQLLHQKSAWCTVERMSATTHPKARVMQRTNHPIGSRASTARSAVSPSRVVLNLVP